MVYNPNQPRDPKGSETGGQWTAAGASARQAAGVGTGKLDENAMKSGVKDIETVFDDFKDVLEQTYISVAEDVDTSDAYDMLTEASVNGAILSALRDELPPEQWQRVVSRAKQNLRDILQDERDQMMEGG